MRIPSKEELMRAKQILTDSVPSNWSDEDWANWFYMQPEEVKESILRSVKTGSQPAEKK